MLEGHVTYNWTKICQKFTKSSELFVAAKFGKQDGLFTVVTKVLDSSLVFMLASRVHLLPD